MSYSPAAETGRRVIEQTPKQQPRAPWTCLPEEFPPSMPTRGLAWTRDRRKLGAERLQSYPVPSLFSDD